MLLLLLLPPLYLQMLQSAQSDSWQATPCTRWSQRLQSGQGDRRHSRMPAPPYPLHSLRHLCPRLPQCCSCHTSPQLPPTRSSSRSSRSGSRSSSPRHPRSTLSSSSSSRQLACPRRTLRSSCWWRWPLQWTWFWSALGPTTGSSWCAGWTKGRRQRTWQQRGGTWAQAGAGRQLGWPGPAGSTKPMCAWSSSSCCGWCLNPEL
mmetsp:Transcript_34094/g.75610  ORF Transcript_34094/g.75610 Transcript_34094/m.75610 type:complete len:204 (-) Transcript_34094:747-1358(-)